MRYIHNLYGCRPGLRLVIVGYIFEVKAEVFVVATLTQKNKIKTNKKLVNTSLLIIEIQRKWTSKTLSLSLTQSYFLIFIKI